MRIAQEKIYKRYAVIRKVSFITYLSIILILPLVAILVLVFEDKGILGQIITTGVLIYLMIVGFVLFVLRRCPNCLSHFSRYVFDPKNCPYCGVKLRE